MSDALLVLEDGTAFRGSAFGASGEAFGEIVFNTGMSGYQEVLTDPSYSRQIVVMTAPHQGNYGVNTEDPESADVQVSGFVVREASKRPSSWRSQGSLGEYLFAANIPGIEGIDTRALTLHIRDAGAMRAAISTLDLDPASLVERVREQPGMEGADLAADVSAVELYAASDLVGAAVPRKDRIFRVAAYDWGLKRNILRLLAKHGCEVDVLPAKSPADAALKNGYDGVFLSNGPGDPAATRYAVETTQQLLISQIPLFGICLGHQIIGRAAGGETYKLKFGHRGANQPVIDRDSGRVEVTSHNHGFAVDPSSWAASPADLPEIAIDPPGGSPQIVLTPFGRAALTHWNLNDGTLEGMRFLDTPAFCVQYHPEAAPGPHDSRYLFDRFLDLMEGA